MHPQNRRQFLNLMSSYGVGGTLFSGALWNRIQDEREIDRSSLIEMEKMAGIEFKDDERSMMLRSIYEYRRGYERLRKIPLHNGVAPAFNFQPGAITGEFGNARNLPIRIGREKVRPSDADLAFASVADLGRLLRGKAVTALELARLFIGRLKKHDEVLNCVVSLDEERSLEAAARADRELKVGKDRGPLHGIPWGAKDIVAAKGGKTTWGAKPFENQLIDEDAAVVERLEAAGAVLVGKLATGALAMGDRWFGGTTRNPWNTSQGSSGSSAGPASAVSAGLLPFAIGSETLGSIVSPCARCGVTGLRPTFGRVSRHGVMALSWTMDKLGPIARTAEDCALVFRAIHGADPRDPSSASHPFDFPSGVKIQDLRVGYVKEMKEGRGSSFDRQTLEKLESLGAKLKPIKIPEFPYRDLMVILMAEAATAFDEITRDGRVRELVSQGRRDWPNTFRAARSIPAVEYIRAQRVRTLVMEAMEGVMKDIDLYVAPSHRGSSLSLTNFTGHPAVVMPNGFRNEQSPTATTFIGRLNDEATLLAASWEWQQKGDFHLKRPPI